MCERERTWAEREKTWAGAGGGGGVKKEGKKGKNANINPLKKGTKKPHFFGGK